MELNKSKKYILVKFSELFLKGGNKKEFISVLKKNIKKKFDDKNILANIIFDRDKFIIESEKDLEKAYKILNEIVGISSFCYAHECLANKEIIENLIKNNLKDLNKNTTFRVSAKIIDSKIFSSKEDMINWLAWLGTNELNFKINLSNYDVDINVKIESNKAIIILNNKNKGIEGLPAGVNGKSLTLLSGGIDSPVSAYKIITRGMNTSFITFLTPKTSNQQTISKIISLANRVNNFNGINGKLFFVNFERVQEKIMQLDNSSYRITLLRRYFIRFAELVSKKYNYKIIVTGDSLGQVASQTPESLTLINNVTEKLITRPLISFSKNEIINLAEKIKTYKISILPGNDMCSSFTPKDPIIFPKKEMVEKLESKLDKMDELLWSVLREDTRIINLGEKNEK